MTKEAFTQHEKALKWWSKSPDRQVWVISCSLVGNWKLESNPNWYSDQIIVPADDYVEFRKALAEGKIIEGTVNWEKSYDYWKEIRADKEGVLTAWTPDCLRIKPDEPEFKVGDWVTYQANSTVETTQVLESHLTDNIPWLKRCTLWQPVHGELVVHWDKLAGNMDSFGVDRYYGESWDNIAPIDLISTLPTHLKDN